MSWKIIGLRLKTILAALLLIFAAANVWLSMEFPFFLGNCSESPLGVYRFRLVAYEVTDYGSAGSIQVMNEFGSLVDGVAVAFGKHLIYRAGHQEYPLRRDNVGIAIFLLYLASLAVNIPLLVWGVVIAIRKKQGWGQVLARMGS